MKKRSGFAVMARLIGLVRPLAGYMLLAILLGLASGAQNFWVFAKERLNRAKTDKNHRVGFNTHQ